MTSNKKIFFGLIFFAILSSFCFCQENATDQIEEKEFILDLPVGYKITTDSSNKNLTLYEHTYFPVVLISDIISKDSNLSAKDVISQKLTKLNANFQNEEFFWNGRKSQIALFNFKLQNDSFDGWCICTPNSDESKYVIVLGYAPSKDFSTMYEPFIVSSINSLCVDFNDYYKPGIFMNYAYPSENLNKIIEITIGDSKIKSVINEYATQASQFFVELEFSVLYLYRNNPQWKAAWERYYRSIFRDNYGRIEKVSKDIVQTLSEKGQKQKVPNYELYVMQELLSWTQTLDYKRADKHTDSDFTCLPGVLENIGCDCDSRSLILCCFAKTLGIDSLLLISPEYSHAMAGILIDAPGQKYNLPNTNYEYLMGETTAKITWGTIAKEHMDRSKWIPVLLY